VAGGEGVTDLAGALLAAEPGERQRLVAESSEQDLEQAVAALGHRRDPQAGAVLALVAAVAASKAIRKAARREVHRLRSIGVQVPDVEPAAESGPTAQVERSPQLVPTEVWATHFDPGGSRALWLLAERPLGGAWLAGLILNDVKGLVELELVDTTRKRFLRDLEEWRRERQSVFVSLPFEYALQLVREGVAEARGLGAALPLHYDRFQKLFGEADHGPDRPLAYQTISPVEVQFNPELQEQASRLALEPEIVGWWLLPTEELRYRAIELVHARHPALLVPGQSPAARALQLMDEAAKKLATPEVRRALKRRLEETAYIFLQTDRFMAARLAVAAAQGLADFTTRPYQHPVVRFMVSTGFIYSLRTEVVDGQSAAEVLLELLDATEQKADEEPSPGTTPSGLILPR
jgi:hypothetical protein